MANIHLQYLSAILDIHQKPKPPCYQLMLIDTSEQHLKAFTLDGDGDFINVADDPALDFGGNDFTVDLWVNFL